LTIWLDMDILLYKLLSGKRGYQEIFTEATIPFCLRIKYFFNLLMHQSLGRVVRLLRLAQLDCQVHDFSTAQKTLKLQLPYRASTGALDLLLDSTGTKFLGDASMMPEFLFQIPPEEPIANVNADGAYDTLTCHEAITERGALAVIQPRQNDKQWKVTVKGANVRNDMLNTCTWLGRNISKKWSDYHRRSLVTTNMHYFKRLGVRVMTRTFERQVDVRQVCEALFNQLMHLCHTARHLFLL
jgi:hypothetical protein